MGYFSNGTEGEMFHKANCDKCIHWKDEGPMCPVLSVHYDWNYAQFDKEKPEVAARTKAILDVLIPESKHPCGVDGPCSMLIERHG